MLACDSLRYVGYSGFGVAQFMNKQKSTSSNRKDSKMWTGRPLPCLLLFLCCWWNVDETLATNPGLKIRLSQPGLNYAATVAAQTLSAKVRRAPLPNQSGSAHTPVGDVSYEIKNMKVVVGD